MTPFKPRQRVWIINCTLGGRFLVEGRARIVRHLGDLSLPRPLSRR